MALPEPKPGLVIAYSYLWRDQALAGASEGRKTRPCAVVLTLEDRDGDLLTYVAPVTHSEPSDPDFAVEIPPSVKRRLGLDELRSWIIADDLNAFTWPGVDLRPVSDARPARYDYGYLPHETFAELKRKVLAARTTGTLTVSKREE
jgi:hypothetical protein